MVGSTQKVLIEQISHRNAQAVQGKTDNNRVVHIPVRGNPAELIGQMRNVRITESVNFSLRGEFID